MRGSYIESYKDLYHGTIESYAQQIVDTKAFIPSREGWCGVGVYFYDIRSKAWWSAKRTCEQERKKGNAACAPSVVIADIKPINRMSILDLRSPDDLQKFADFVDEFLAEENFEIEEEMSENERLRLKRALLLNFFCEENNQKLVVGYFKQQPRQEINETRIFAEAWQLAIGIETIYCVKDTSIIENIRRR